MCDSTDDRMESDLIGTPGPMGWGQRLAILLLLVVALWGWGAYVYQLRVGLAATAMNDYFSWGIYIVNFVFFIGISMAGTLISAMLRLSGAHWRAPITRMAEAVTLFSLLIAGPMVIIDMGRPDRFYMIFLHGRFQSPILWDVLSLSTYLAGSLLYLYLPMIPDMALLRDCKSPIPGYRRRLYSTLAIGWRGTDTQRHALERAIFVMAIVILPVAISIHTVTAWLFGMTLRPGWHSTIIGPDFVVGALYSGVAAVITVIAVFRWLFSLQGHLTADHFVKLARLLLVFGLVYAYFVVNEHIGSIYVNEGAEQRLDLSMFTGAYRTEFWGTVVIGLVVPVVMLVLPWRRRIGWIVGASVLVNIGMWLKRYIIVVPTLASPYMPVVSGKSLSYVPTWVEWSITIGALAGFSLMYVLFARLFPIVSIWEVQEEEREARRHVSPAPGRLAVGPATIVLLLVGVASVMCVGRASAADTAPSTRPAAHVDLAVVTEEGQKTLKATVTSNGRPLANAKVDFGAARSFGQLKLGEDTTLDDGTAAVPFPVGLPNSADGKLHLCAQVKSPAEWAGACAEIISDGPARAAQEPFPRALWAPSAPIALLAVIAVLIGGVWLTYAYAVLQLVTVFKGARV